jgi:hypothetical protein
MCVYIHSAQQGSIYRNKRISRGQTHAAPAPCATAAHSGQISYHIRGQISIILGVKSLSYEGSNLCHMRGQISIIVGDGCSFRCQNLASGKKPDFHHGWFFRASKPTQIQATECQECVRLRLQQESFFLERTQVRWTLDKLNHQEIWTVSVCIYTYTLHLHVFKHDRTMQRMRANISHEYHVQVCNIRPHTTSFTSIVSHQLIIEILIPMHTNCTYVFIRKKSTPMKCARTEDTSRHHQVPWCPFTL